MRLRRAWVLTALVLDACGVQRGAVRQDRESQGVFQGDSTGDETDEPITTFGDSYADAQAVTVAPSANPTRSAEACVEHVWTDQRQQTLRWTRCETPCGGASVRFSSEVVDIDVAGSLALVHPINMGVLATVDTRTAEVVRLVGDFAPTEIGAIALESDGRAVISVDSGRSLRFLDSHGEAGPEVEVFDNAPGYFRVLDLSLEDGVALVVGHRFEDPNGSGGTLEIVQLGPTQVVSRHALPVSELWGAAIYPERRGAWIVAGVGGGLAMVVHVSGASIEAPLAIETLSTAAPDASGALVFTRWHRGQRTEFFRLDRNRTVQRLGELPGEQRLVGSRGQSAYFVSDQRTARMDIRRVSIDEPGSALPIGTYLAGSTSQYFQMIALDDGNLLVVHERLVFQPARAGRICNAS